MDGSSGTPADKANPSPKCPVQASGPPQWEGLQKLLQPSLTAAEMLKVKLKPKLQHQHPEAGRDSKASSQEQQLHLLTRN